MTRRSAIYNYAARLADECREHWFLYLMDWQEKAAAACSDHLVNDKGRSQGVSLHQMIAAPGARQRFRAYASEELREYMESNPHLTREAFEAQWLAGHQS